MKYLYYPGCSLEGTAREYDISTRALMAALDVELTELPDWVCCGASAAEATDRMLALSLPAINLAIAEGMEASDQLMVPCSACYLNLKKTEETARKSPETLDKINLVLAEKGLKLTNTVRTRHLLDVLSRDVGAAAIQERVSSDLSPLTIAPYYGCQCLRPYPVFDDPERPTSMTPLIEATGASVFEWEMGGSCCGASHMNTKIDVALELVHGILAAAKGADAVVTVCPMCQMNLEAYQEKIAAKYRESANITILYLPQLLGLAVGIGERELGMPSNLAIHHLFRYKMRKAANM